MRPGKGFEVPACPNYPDHFFKHKTENNDPSEPNVKISVIYVCGSLIYLPWLTLIHKIERCLNMKSKKL